VSSASLGDIERALSKLSSKDPALVHQALLPFCVPFNSAESEVFAERNTIREIFSLESVEEILAALERRKGSSFATKTLAILNKLSPTSLKVTHRQMRVGRDLDLESCFKLEYKLSQAFMKSHDFYEGVRAQLVDKTKDPKWNPPTISQVSSELVNKFFNDPAVMDINGKESSAKL